MKSSSHISRRSLARCGRRFGTRQLLATSTRRPVAAASGCLDPDEVAGREITGDLGGKVVPVQEVAPGRAGPSTLPPFRRMPAPLAQDREAARFEHAQLANDTVAPAMSSTSARASP